MNKESMVKDAELRTTPSPGPSTQGEKEDWIGRQLRRVFDSALSEPLPDDIMSLLDRLDDAPPAGNPEGSKGSA
ncbi:NepR family anti-sigma factor [Kaistia sp. 32K]|uniref:NepR family anti-sigma factor n=1 Tax=Kaistia sp. 32K TaxID=2795690 RepID=UPI001915912A|nr:NepR family anti-sigma factor [Kaistia sp. 32K]